MTRQHGFPKSVRVRKRRDYLRIQDSGAKLAVGPLLAVWARNSLPYTRLGLTVSSKVGNAVVRARVRRHLREYFRLHRSELPQGLDLVLIARASAGFASGEDLARAFAEIARRLRGVVK
ncbi:MAG: ribonuclease P protein component [Myxococcaceae bacterium]|nr:ribonuclease P protein component [Myxococcaceae bacterium]